MKQFRLVDNIVGWLTFAIAAFVYCSTIEPTASFWDCPEFITTGYKLEIGHPPGAPFFMLTANLFSQFASDPSQVARMVNTMSALLSATCILFLFWTITHLVRRLLIDRWEELSASKMLAIEASGLVGALIYTFSDTFWFSAVEGEVYAYSSAFTAVVFWLILKWEDHADEPHSDRWLVLIMYMTGLSIGVHLLNLLCLPAIVLVWYYKRFPNANLKGSIVALIVSFIILAAVLYGVVPGIITVGGWFELLFVNVFGMPFNTGLYVYILLLVGTVIWAIYETQNASDKNWKRQNIAFLVAFALLGVPFYGFGFSAVAIGIVVLALLAWVLFRRTKQQPLVSPRLKNTALLCMLMLMIGYSTYAVIVIRSSANPPMDQNSPEDIFTLGNYLSRDQYGYRPLLWGQAYSSEYAVKDDGHIKMDKGAPIYQRREKASPDEPDRYFIVSQKDKPIYAQNMLFPRMYSNQANHVQFYKDWLGGIEGYQRPSNYRQGDYVTIPTQMENLRFFLSYQCNFMYWRYFMWNFAGRQNDLQGNGELERGNWITGIKFFDNARLGDQSKLPTVLRQNKGHNVFYCMPLILGLIGLLWQALKRGQKGIKQFWVVFFLFVMTGLAIVVYLNQTPFQPRERDYAYAGSFYAFAIWCGMGVAAIWEMLCRQLKKLNPVVLASIVSIGTIAVPIQMASQTWDDHDRSGRYTCRDFGQNYLESLQQTGNPIIFTNGDNDTFPLWYNQDAEGVRTDARVCNLSYLQTDWYIDQMRRPAYDSPSLPITWSRLEYCSGTNESVQVDPRLKKEVIDFYAKDPENARRSFGDEPFELKNILRYWVRSKNPDLQVIPTDTVYMTIDKDAVRRSGMLLQGDSIPDRMVISLKGLGYLDKSKLMMLELISQSNWERPIYIAYTVGEENYMNLGDNFVQEGLVNRVTPFTTNVDGRTLPGMTDFDADKTYDNVMNRFKFGNVNAERIYLDETVMRMCFTHRRLLVKLAMELAMKGDEERALKVLDRCEEELPNRNVPHDYQSSSHDMARIYAVLGHKDKAQGIIDEMWLKAMQYIDYYTSLDQKAFKSSEQSCRLQFYLMQSMLDVVKIIDPKLEETYTDHLRRTMQAFANKGGTLR